MPTKAERQVYGVLAEELRDIPVKGQANRAKLENVIEAIEVMQGDCPFGQGRYENMDHVMLIVRLRRRMRSRRRMGPRVKTRENRSSTTTYRGST